MTKLIGCLLLVVLSLRVGDFKDRARELCLQLRARSEPSYFTGVSVLAKNGTWLREVKWHRPDGSSQAVGFSIQVPEMVAAPGEVFGVFAKVGCVLPEQNPAWEMGAMRPRARFEKSRRVFYLRDTLSRKAVRILEEGLGHGSVWSQLAQASWVGLREQLPFWLYEKYRERGLLAILALSGQHALCLALLFSFFATPRKASGVLYYWLRLSLLPVAAFLLLLTSLAEGSMVRTVVWVLALLGVHLCDWKLDKRWITFLAISLLLLVFPEWAMETGFWLSFLGAYWTVSVSHPRFSWLFIPASLGALSFLFAEVSVFSAWYGFFWGMGWAVCLLPLAFFGMAVSLSSWMTGLAVPEWALQFVENGLDLWLGFEAVSTSGALLPMVRLDLWQGVLVVYLATELGGFLVRRLEEKRAVLKRLGLRVKR